MAEETNTPTDGVESVQNGGVQTVDTPISQNNESEVAERPDDVPEKFWDSEKGAVNTKALLESYTELEKRQSSNNTDDDTSDEGDTEDGAQKSKKDLKIDDGDEDSEGGDNPLTKAVTEAEKAFAEEGTLSEDHIKSLVEAGLPEEVVKNYVAGLDALQAQFNQSAYSAAGGEEEYGHMVEWAKENLDAKEVDQFNKALDSDVDAAISAIKGLSARWRADVGTEGKSVEADSVQTNGEGYQSSEEMQKDMADPLYKKDPAFRAKVQRKIANTKNTTNLGVDILEAPVQM